MLIQILLTKYIMKNLKFVVILLSLFVFVACGAAGGDYLKSPEEVSQVLAEQGDGDLQIIDVRTPEEFAEGYIENAINIDFYAETFRDDINQLDRSQTYLVYCRSGRRSADALGIMAELGFKEAYNLLGGIIDWKAAGLPFTK